MSLSKTYLKKIKIKLLLLQDEKSQMASVHDKNHLEKINGAYFPAILG